MRHIHGISRLPRAAQTTPTVCTGVASDFQARLCFLFQLLTQFFLPLAEIKNPAEPTDTTT